GAAATGAAGAAAMAGAAMIAGCTWVTTPPVGMRLMRTASSPSLISISAIPDSSSSSISFLTLRMSNLCAFRYQLLNGRDARPLTGGYFCRCRLDRELVPQCTQADDAAHGDVREIGVVTKFFACEGVREMQLDERQFHAEQRVAQRHAGVREAARVDDGEADAVGLGRLHPIDQFVFGIALEGDQLMAEPGGGVPGAFFYGGQRVGPVNFGLALPQQVQVRPV